MSESCTNVAMVTDHRLAVYRLGHLEAELLTLLGYMPSDEELAKSITDLEVLAN